MSKLPGLFDIFDNLDQIRIEDIARWLKPQPKLEYIENFLAQRILYPQAVPLTSDDMKIDLAIMREALRMASPWDKSSNPLLGDNTFLNITLRKILIPQRFLTFIPDLTTLTWTFVDGLLFGRSRKDFFEDLWTVVLEGETDEVIGSVLLPQFKDKDGVLQITVLGKTHKICAGTLTLIPCPKSRCEVSFTVRSGKILGKEDLALEVYGGKLGLMIDGRER